MTPQPLQMIHGVSVTVNNILEAIPYDYGD